MRAWIVAAVLAALLLPAAPAAADPTREAVKLAAARERWSAQHARDYTFRLRLSCFCVLREPVKIHVRDGKPRGTPRALRRFDTVPELFKRIREEIDRGGDGLDARYGALTGVPRDFSADPLPRAIDDEYSVTVRRLRITRRG
jgi:hypothetical protein